MFSRKPGSSFERVYVCARGERVYMKLRESDQRDFSLLAQDPRRTEG